MRVKGGAPLLDRLVNNTLVKFIPDSLDTLAQIINIVYLHVVHLLLKYRPDFIINWIQIRTIRRPACWQDESWCFSRKKINCFLRAISWRVCLLKDIVAYSAMSHNTIQYNTIQSKFV